MKHIVFAISSLFGGGAERVVSVWSSALAEKGYRVSVLVYSRVENEYPVDTRVNVYPIATSGDECNSMSMIKRLRCFRTILKKINPDVIISFLPVIQVYIALASFGMKIPRIETVRINPWETKILRTKFAKLWKWCFRTCHAVILQSEDQKTFFNLSIQKKSVVIPNPINPKFLAIKKEVYSASSHKIVAAGRLSEQKNYKVMIDAVKIVLKDFEDVSLSIYGVGELEDELRLYIKSSELENHVKLMGRSNELHKVYLNSDVYVMSSDYEGMPNALAEAMAIGLPCISTDCKTGPRDLIDDGINGFLVPCNDSEMLAERIKMVFNLSNQEQKQIGEKAREKIATFCGEISSLEKLIELIERVG